MLYHDRPLEYLFPYGMGVIFNSDGVLVNSEPVSLEAFRRMYAEVNIELSEDDLTSVIGHTAEASASMMWDRHGYFMKHEEYLEREERNYRQLVDEQGIAVFPGVIDLLDELADQQIPFALASSGHAAKIEMNLAAARLKDRFSIVVSGDDVDWGKPDPEIFLLAASHLSLPPERCIVIEDSIAGVEAARRAGMSCVAVTNTFTAQALAGADCVVHSLERVNLALLRKLMDTVSDRLGRG